MILLDCGNSSLKAQQLGSGQVVSSFASSYRGGWPRRLARWMQTTAASGCCLSSVLDAKRQAQLDQCLEQQFGGMVTRFESEARGAGVINGYEQPGRLGVDRWLALIGAAQRIGGDCVVIDAGSAITLDLLRGDGQHLGGAILPGINTSLQRFKEIFSHIDFEDPRIGHNDEPGSSTEAAIQIDYPDRSIDRLRDLVTSWIKRLDQNASLLLTGGDAFRLQSELEQPGRIVPDLVFLGMRRLAEQ